MAAGKHAIVGGTSSEPPRPLSQLVELRNSRVVTGGAREMGTQEAGQPSPGHRAVM